MRKAIYFILDTLLVIGALLGVLTINRGKWITNGQVAVFSSEAGQNSQTGSAAPDVGETATSENSSQKTSDCSNILLGSSPDWYLTYPMLEAYQAEERQQDQQAPEC